MRQIRFGIQTLHQIDTTWNDQGTHVPRCEVTVKVMPHALGINGQENGNFENLDVPPKYRITMTLANTADTKRSSPS